MSKIEKISYGEGIIQGPIVHHHPETIMDRNRGRGSVLNSPAVRVAGSALVAAAPFASTVLPASANFEISPLSQDQDDDRGEDQSWLPRLIVTLPNISVNITQAEEVGRIIELPDLASGSEEQARVIHLPGPENISIETDPEPASSVIATPSSQDVALAESPQLQIEESEQSIVIVSTSGDLPKASQAVVVRPITEPVAKVNQTVSISTKIATQSKSNQSSSAQVEKSSNAADQPKVEIQSTPDTHVDKAEGEIEVESSARDERTGPQAESINAATISGSQPEQQVKPPDEGLTLVAVVPSSVATQDSTQPQQDSRTVPGNTDRPEIQAVDNQPGATTLAPDSGNTPPAPVVLPKDTTVIDLPDTSAEKTDPSIAIKPTSTPAANAKPVAAVSEDKASLKIPTPAATAKPASGENNTAIGITGLTPESEKKAIDDLVKYYMAKVDKRFYPTLEYKKAFARDALVYAKSLNTDTPVYQLAAWLLMWLHQESGLYPKAMSHNCWGIGMLCENQNIANNVIKEYNRRYGTKITLEDYKKMDPRGQLKVVFVYLDDEFHLRNREVLEFADSGNLEP